MDRIEIHRFSEPHNGAIVIANGFLHDIPSPRGFSRFLMMTKGVTMNAGIGMMGSDEAKNRGLVFVRPRAAINPVRGKQHPVSSMLEYDAPE